MEPNKTIGTYGGVESIELKITSTNMDRGISVMITRIALASATPTN